MINCWSHAVIASDFGGKMWCELIIDWNWVDESRCWLWYLKSYYITAQNWDSVSKSSNTWTPNWPKRSFSTQFICSESRTHTIWIYKKNMSNFGCKNQGDLWDPWDNLKYISCTTSPSWHGGGLQYPSGSGRRCWRQAGTLHLLLHGLL